MPARAASIEAQHEFIFVYKRGQAAHINTFQLGQNGRNRSNVWSYAGVEFLPGRPHGRAKDASNR